MTKIYGCFVPCWKNRKQYTKIHLYRTCSIFNPISFHHHRKDSERIWCLKPPCEKSWALNKEKGILREYSRIFSPCLSRTTSFSFIPRNYSTVFHLFHRIQQVFASAQVALLCPCSWCPFLECPFPYALLVFTEWFEAANSFFFFLWWRRIGVKITAHSV